MLNQLKKRYSEAIGKFSLVLRIEIFVLWLIMTIGLVKEAIVHNNFNTYALTFFSALALLVLLIEASAYFEYRVEELEIDPKNRIRSQLIGPLFIRIFLGAGIVGTFFILIKGIYR